MLLKDFVKVFHGYSKLFIQVGTQKRGYLFDYDVISNNIKNILDKMEIDAIDLERERSCKVAVSFVKEFQQRNFVISYIVNASSNDELKFLEMEMNGILDKDDLIND